MRPTEQESGEDLQLRDWIGEGAESPGPLLDLGDSELASTVSLDLREPGITEGLVSDLPGMLVSLSALNYQFREFESQPGVPAYEVHEISQRVHDAALIIPVINEGDRLLRQLARVSSVAAGVDVIVADGGSTDGSTDLTTLAGLGVSTLLVMRGPGRLSAELRAAFDYVLARGYEYVLTMDGNDKDGAEGIRAIVAALEGGADFVQGSRFVPGGVSENTPKSRELAIKFLHAPVVSLAARHKYTDTTNGFRGHSRRLLLDPGLGYFREVFETYEHVAYFPIRSARLGYKCCEVPVSRSYPPGKPPSKIGGISGQLDLLSLLWGAARGRFNPPRSLPLPPPLQG